MEQQASSLQCAGTASWKWFHDSGARSGEDGPPSASPEEAPSMPSQLPTAVSREHDGCMVLLVPYQEQHFLAVRCMEEKCVLARRSADIACKVLECSAGRLQEDRLCSAHFSQFHLEMPRDHFNLVEVPEGPFRGLRAMGIGTNKTKLSRACRLALSLLAVVRGGAAAPEEHPDFASLLALAEEAAASSSCSMPLAVNFPELQEAQPPPRPAEQARCSSPPRQTLPSRPVFTVTAPTTLPASVAAAAPADAAADLRPTRRRPPRSAARARSGAPVEPEAAIAEQVDWMFLVTALERLRSGLGGPPDQVQDCIEVVKRSMPRCERCRAACDARVLAPLRLLERAARDAPLRPEAAAGVRGMLRGQLDAPQASVLMPIQDVRYTQDHASGSFAHGPHSGRSVVDLAEDLACGRVQTTEDSMVLDVIFWHGEYWSCNNRHLKALKLYMRMAHPDRKPARGEEMARVRVWPLNHNLRLPGGWTVTRKFARTFDARRCGRGLSLRRSQSPLARALSSQRVG